jgi:hypothetical protein
MPEPIETSQPSFRLVAGELVGDSIDGIERAGSGANSRIFRVRAGARTYALKVYPRRVDDPRDRQGVERDALRFFERHGLACVPQWIRDCPGHTLMTWIEGERVSSPRASDLAAAVAFVSAIKRLSREHGASDLPSASDACRSGAEMLARIVEKLERLSLVSAQEPMLGDLLAQRIVPALARVRTHAEAAYARAGLAFDGVSVAKTCLVPADFGFHNALRRRDGALSFLDFEYFGWDDPVKLTVDFLLHPGHRLSVDQRRRFLEEMRSLFSDDPSFETRLLALKPMLALHWALILLNDFLPERRSRSGERSESEWRASMRKQLQKASMMLGQCDS